MKKLLSLINAFNITILTSLTSVACKENEANDNAIDTSTENELSTIQEEEFFEQNDIDTWTSDETETKPEENSGSVPTVEPPIPEENKDDLNTIDNLHLPSLEINLAQKYNALNNKIIASKAFEFKRVRRGFKVKYYNAQTEGAEITANNQQAGSVWVEISANPTNQFWKGKTNRISITLVAPLSKVKKNLNTIVDQISPIKFRPNQPYNSLNLQIVKNINELKTNPLASGYKIDYYTPATLFGIDKTDSTVIQKVGIVFIKITAALNDPNWSGFSNKLKIELKESIKIDLNTIRDITFAPISNTAIKANSMQPYSSLNAEIIQKVNKLAVFKLKALSKGYQIKYYTRNLLFSYTEINSTVKQAIGKVYAEITPSANDRYWSGSTKFKIKLI